MAHPVYDDAFMQYAAQSSAYAAAVVAGLLAPELKVRSVLDAGCAQGTWLKAWSEHGAADIQGIDGDYVDRSQLEIPQDRFKAVDLTGGFDLGRQFDLVQSLEVAEHIAPEAAQRFVDCLARHARRTVLFSAAPPGQGGESHVNEQSYDFWRAAFARHDFCVIDVVRPAIIEDARISYWYRYNLFLYVRRAELAGLSAELKRHVVPDGEPLADLSPLSFRLRKMVVRSLPGGVQNGIARMKAKIMPTGRI